VLSHGPLAPAVAVRPCTTTTTTTHANAQALQSLHCVVSCRVVSLVVSLVVCVSCACRVRVVCGDVYRVRRVCRGGWTWRERWRPSGTAARHRRSPAAPDTRAETAPDFLAIK
jgi:hypothetical protein